ncbi:MAG: outer membrane lipoprotein-sorting protein [Spirochaetales bacterium]|nr:outer membrane lipoprotein-sorting protein [Spirochaetales bacterium]
MKKIILILTVIFVIFPLFGESDPREIMALVNARDTGDSAVSDMEMVLVDQQERQRSRSIKSYMLDDGEVSRTVMFFTAPGDVRGTGFLTWDYEEESKDDEQWLYLPALRKTNRIAGSDKSQSFMGSDFNYSDMNAADLNEFNYTLIQEGKVDGQDVWVIMAVPVSRDIARETGYEKSALFIRKDNYMIVRAKKWTLRSGEEKFMQVKEMRIIDGIWIPTRMEMTTRRNGSFYHQTLLNRSNIRINIPMDENMFTVSGLERGIQ